MVQVRNVCPLLTMALNSLMPCENSNCAWYEENNGMCAIKMIADKIEDISMQS